MIKPNRRPRVGRWVPYRALRIILYLLQINGSQNQQHWYFPLVFPLDNPVSVRVAIYVPLISTCLSGFHVVFSNYDRLLYPLLLFKIGHYQKYN